MEIPSTYVAATAACGLRSVARGPLARSVSAARGTRDVSGRAVPGGLVSGSVRRTEADVIYLFQDLVKDLYDTFGTPATLLDVNDRVLAFSEQPPGLADAFRRDALLMAPVDAELEKAVVRHVNDVARTVTDVTRIPAAPQLGLLERVVIPLLANGVASAYVYLIDPQRKVSDEQLQPFEALFSDVARHVELERMSRSRLPAAVVGIVSGDARERRIAAEMIDELGVVRIAPPMCVAVITSRLPIDGMSNTLWRRIFGPCRSAIRATGLPTFSATSRTSCARATWSCALP